MTAALPCSFVRLAGALLLGTTLALAASAPRADVTEDPPEKAMLNILEAHKNRSYAALVVDFAGPSQVTPEMFEKMSERLGPRLKAGYKTTYLDGRREAERTEYRWRIEFADKKGDLVVSLSIRDKKIAGLMFRPDGATGGEAARSGDRGGQQVADTAFSPPIPSPAYPPRGGPVVMVDEAHNNFHTASGRYLPFAELLRRDGYVVVPSREPFIATSLKRGAILVIANAVAAQNVNNPTLPTPSAFTPAEISAVRAWVAEGGSLLLIADHMPWPGAANELAAAFGARWSNGFAMEGKNDGPMIFRRDDGSLTKHAITRGRRSGEQVERVATFTGSAFRLETKAEPLLVLRASVESLEPQTAGVFTPETKRVPVKGWYQGAVLRHGKGRVALFGEAAMFTAQLAGPGRLPMGMNAPTADQNAQFLLNVLHWLSGKLK
jgi:uncharacterized protein (DUF2249 family)